MISRLSFTRSRWLVIVTALAALLLMVPNAAFAHTSSHGHGFYQQTNLVSDTKGAAQFTDSNLVNPWGLSHSSTSPWWISDNGTGVSTLYQGDGSAVPLVVTIPPPKGSPTGTTATPTGNVFNPFNTTNPDDFVVKQDGNSAPALFIFATEDGTISGWNRTVDPTNAILEVDHSTIGAGAVYKGLAIASYDSHEYLYAANFRFGTIDVFNANFHQVHLKGSFTDRSIPKGYAPFNIQLLNGRLYVTYAKQDAQKHDDAAGPGHGFVDVYSTEGKLIRRLVSRDQLNSPWGLALAPDNFGRFSNALLVGNFGDGLINAYNPHSGKFLGHLKSKGGHSIQIDGLWGLAFGNGAAAGAINELFFTAGVDHEQHGLFGKIVSEN